MITALRGGAATGLVHWASALEGRSQLVLCDEASTHRSEYFERELERVSAKVVTVHMQEALRFALDRVRPAIVLHHWQKDGVARCASPSTSERWVCIGSAPLSLPPGYDAYVIASEFQRGHQRHLPEECVHLIPNAVDLERFPCRDLKNRGGPVTIVMLSRLDPGKFPIRLLAYLPPLVHCRVMIGGSGSRRFELEPMIEKVGLADRILFAGTVPYRDVPRFLAEADIGLHITETHEETFGQTVLEMLAAGLPVVAQPRGALPELIVPGANGFLASSEQELASRLEELVSCEPMRRQLGATARQSAEQFDMPRFRDAVQALVGELEATAAVPTAPPVSVRPSTVARATPRLSYLIFTLRGCGSAPLCNGLRATGVAGDPQDVVSALSTARIIEHACRSLAELFERTVTPNGVFGGCVFAEDLPRLLSGIRATVGEGRSEEVDLLARVFPNLHIIKLTRNDRVRQAIAIELAQQTGVHEGMSDPLPFDPPRPRFDAAAIKQRLHEIDGGHARWRSLIEARGLRPVDVSYEDLERNYAGSIRRILAELGIRSPAGISLEAPLSVSGMDALTEQWVARYSASSTKRANKSAHTRSVS